MLADFTCSCFAVLDYTSKFIEKGVWFLPGQWLNIFRILSHPKLNSSVISIKFATKIIVNIFFNNKQKIAADTVRKDAIVAFKSRQLGKK